MGLKVAKGDFKVSNINDLELLYSILRETYPNNEIKIVYNWNKREYDIKVTELPYKKDPDVPVDLQIQVVYGDSVTGDTPLILRDPITKMVCIKTISDLCKEWIEYPHFKVLDTTIRLEKQYGVTNYEVWCDKGWNPIKKVIRHKTDKKIYRVLSSTGVVDVTEDHSLCTTNLEKIKPTDLKIGQEILHSFPVSSSEINCDAYLSRQEAELWGNLFNEKDFFIPNLILNASNEIKESFLKGVFK